MEGLTHVSALLLDKWIKIVYNNAIITERNETGMFKHKKFLSCTLFAFSLLMMLQTVACNPATDGTQQTTDATTEIEQTTDAACYLIIADSDTLRVATSQRWQF